jgi:hypothetical protein
LVNQANQPPPQTTGSGMEINLDLQVNPSTEVQLIFDPTVGDVIKANGSGNLNINHNRRGELRITGDYVIDNGDYLFTLGNLLNKQFSVQNGSRIIFNGDIDNADIDIRAIYRLRASLAEIVPSNVVSSHERVQVECQLNLSGKLFNPKIDLNINLPTVDESTRAFLRSATSTEEQMSQQFLYLLVMNSFYPDPNMGLGNSTNTGTASAAAVTSTEMLFSQLSNMLSKISNDFDIGVAYRPGANDMTPEQLEVALSTQILNNRVILNTNFDVRGANNDPDVNQITGDFEAEVKITERIRFKVFNRYNNPYRGGKPEPYTQGVGIFFRQEFNKFSDLFKRKRKADIRKEDNIAIEKETS